MKTKKNTKKTAKTKKETKQQTKLPEIPTYFVILLIVLAFVGGYAISILLNPETSITPIETTTITEEPTVKPILDPIKITLLYNEDCVTCEKTISFEKALKVNGIEYEVEEVEMDTNQGQVLIENYEIKSLPVMLVEAESVDPFIVVNTNQGVTAPLKKVLESNLQDDMYVIEEIYLDDKLHDTYFLKSPDEDCISEGGRIRIQLFDDTYCPACIKKLREEQELREKFKDYIDMEFVYRPSTMLEMRTQYEFTELTAQYLLCAQEQGMYSELDEEIKTIYCDKTSDRELNDQEVQNCKFLNERWGKPLIKEELDAAVKRAELNSEVFYACLEDEDFGKMWLQNETRINKYNIQFVPSAVVDCQYLTQFENIDDMICSINPEIPACEVSEESVEQSVENTEE